MGNGNTRSQEQSGQLDKEELVRFTSLLAVKRGNLGYLPQVVNTLFLERAKYKKLMKAEVFGSPTYKLYNMRQLAYKILMNALYGQTAFPGSRLYDARIAETVTWMGRQVITWSQHFMQDLGFEVIYMDTDSLHWVLGCDLNIHYIEILNECLNISYDKFAEQYGLKKHIFHMEFEKIYRKVFYGSKKKRYAGWICYKDGQNTETRDVFGFEIRRSDAAQFSKKLQERIFDMLLKENKSKDEIMRYVRDEIHRIRTGNFKFVEIGMPKGMTKDPMDYFKGKYNSELKAWQQKGLSANIRGVLYSLKELNLDLTSKPKMLYVSKLPAQFPPTDAICFDKDGDIPAGTELNIEVMLDKLVKNKLQPIFEALGWSMKELSYHWKGKAPDAGEQLGMLIESDMSAKKVPLFEISELLTTENLSGDLPF